MRVGKFTGVFGVREGCSSLKPSKAICSREIITKRSEPQPDLVLDISRSIEDR